MAAATMQRSLELGAASAEPDAVARSEALRQRAEQLGEERTGKVCDPDDKVRTTAVKAVCAACWESIGPFAPLVAAARLGLAGAQQLLRDTC